jgi:hypothetical protein
MPKYIRRVGAPIVLAAFTAFAACRSDAKKGPDSVALSTDSTLNRDLALAGRDSAAQPQLKDVPATTPEAPAPAATKSTTPARRTPPKPAPRNEPKTAPKTAPAATPPAPVTTASGNTVTTNPKTGTASEAGGGAVGMIPAGTTLNTNASSKVCTGTNQVGDHVTATVENSVTGSNGATIPAGATVNMTVTQLKRSENANDPIVMEFAVNSISFGGHTYPIEATVQSASITRVKDQPGDKTAQKVAIGAAVGAIAGRIIGKSTKGTIVGGAAGAAAGAAAAAATTNYQGCIDAGGAIVLKLTSPATVKA